MSICMVCAVCVCLCVFALSVVGFTPPPHPRPTPLVPGMHSPSTSLTAHNTNMTDSSVQRSARNWPSSGGPDTCWRVSSCHEMTAGGMGSPWRSPTLKPPPMPACLHAAPRAFVLRTQLESDSLTDRHGSDVISCVSVFARR